MSAVVKRNLNNGLHRAGLIVGLAGVLALVVSYVAGSEMQRMYAIFVSLFVPGLPYLILALAGWKWPREGGLVLIILGSAVIIVPFLLAGTRAIWVGVGLGPPLLVPGILFFLSTRQAHRRVT